MFTVISYFLLFAFIHFIFGDKVSKNKLALQQQVVIVFIALFIFWGFRGLTVLNDTNHYYLAQYKLINSYNFEQISVFHINKKHIWEPGFLIYCNIIGKIFTNPYALIIISTSILILSTIYILKKNTPYVALAIFLLMSFGYFFGQVSAIRQGLALSIFYLSFESIKKKKHYLTLTLLVAAYFFHTSASVLFILWVLSYVEITRRNVIIGLSATIIILVFMGEIVSLINLNDNAYFEQALNRKNMAIAAILFTVIQGIVLISGMKLKYMFRIPMPINMITWGALLNFFFTLFSVYIQVFARFSIYFGVFSVLFFMHFILHSPRRVRVVYLLITGTILLAQNIMLITYRNEWYHLVPYSIHNIFSDVQIIHTGY